MKVGTKSVLFGAHIFFLHPWFVAWGWWKLYGFPWDPRLWIAFLIHDLGYWGSPNMDGDEGEKHPEWAARIMARVFDRVEQPPVGKTFTMINAVYVKKPFYILGRWGALCLFHSRFYSKQFGAKPSRLCFADKKAICLTPWWIYRWTAGLTGEIREYRKYAAASNGGLDGEKGSDREWYLEMQAYVQTYIDEFKDGKEDTWTPSKREVRDETGVYK